MTVCQLSYSVWEKRKNWDPMKVRLCPATNIEAFGSVGHEESSRYAIMVTSHVVTSRVFHGDIKSVVNSIVFNRVNNKEKLKVLCFWPFVVTGGVTDKRASNADFVSMS